MTKKLLFATTVMLVLALALAGADAITGKWTYEQPMGRGGMGGGGGAPGGGGPGGGAPGGGAPGGQAMPPRIVSMDLKADGATLTGTVTMPAFGGRGGGGGGQAPAPTPTNITNGKVNGDVITFDVTRETQMGSMTSKYKGTVKGSEMQLEITTDRGNGPQTQTVTAKKS